MASNSTRGHSTDQARGTDVDVGDVEGRSGGSAVVERERRGKDGDGVGSDEGQAKLRENQGWLTPNGPPSAYHPSGDIGEWPHFAGVENKSSGNAHIVTDLA